MSKQANPTTVGIFVIGGVFLTIAGIITFGKTKFFADETTFVAYFDSSVSGLDVGAPVEILGVRVGTVSGVKGVIDPGTLDIKIPVYLTLDRSSLETSRELTRMEAQIPIERSVEVMIEKGLRAELNKQSLVTGKLFVALVFAPNSAKHYQGDEEYFEIPTTEGGLAKLAKNLEDIDFEGLVAEATRAVESVRELAENPEIRQLVHDLSELVQKLNAEFDTLSASARTLMADVDQLVKNADGEVAELSDSSLLLIQGLDRDREALVGEAGKALAQFNTFGNDYTVMHRTAALLDELTAAARSIRLLADFLERHPEALIKGKK